MLGVGALLGLAPPAQAAYPGSNGELAFVAANGVASVNPDGSNTFALAPGTDPSWSPTGTRIVYSCIAEGVEQVCEILPDGSGQASLTINGGTDPQYTPGGDIAFVRPAGGFDQVFTMNDDGGEIGLVQRTSDPRDHSDPTYTPVGGPDGDEEIAYAADGDIWTTEIGEGEPTNLTHRYSLGDAAHPDFSPDGTRIAFAAGGNLYSIAADGSAIQQVTDPAGGGVDTAPVFSPDGTRIAFSRNPPDGGARLTLVDPDGSDVMAITAGEAGVSEVEPSWQPVVPALFEVTNAPNARTAQCPAGSVLLGGGHIGIEMGFEAGDDETPDSNGSWSVVGEDNDYGSSTIGVSASCGDPTYFQTNTAVEPSPMAIICGPFYISPTICEQGGGGDVYYIADAQLYSPCADGEQVVAGGFLADDGGGRPNEGTGSKSSTLGGGNSWLANGWVGGVEAKSSFQTLALCLQHPVSAPAIAQSSIQEGPFVDSDDFWSWNAECPPGSAAIAGGWQRTDPDDDSGWPLVDSYQTDYEETDYGALPTEWFFRMEVSGTGSPTDTAVLATCAVLPSGLEAPGQNGALTFVDGTGDDAQVRSSDGAPGTSLETGGAASSPQWLPDASGFAFAAGGRHGGGKLLLYNDADDAVYPLGARRLRGSSASVAPDLRRVAFARPSGAKESSGIFLGSILEPRIDPLTGGRRDRSPVFSPDGERIAFVRGPSGRSSVFTVADEGGAKLRISPRGISAADPDYSPDGDRVVFAGHRHGCAALYAVGPNGGNAEKLTPCESRAEDPAWSPNGKRIAYSTRTAGGSRILDVPAGGGSPRVIERGAGVLGDPDWRPYPGRSGPPNTAEGGR